MEMRRVPHTVRSRNILTGVAVSSAIFAVIMHLPIVGFFCSLLLPLPVLFYRSKDGRKTAGIIAGLTLATMILILGSVTPDLIFFIELMLIGWVLGELFEQALPVEQTVLITTVAAVLTAGTGVVVYSGFSGTGPIAFIRGYVDANLQMTLKLYEQMGVSEDTLVRVSNSVDQIRYVLVRIMPSLAVASALFVTWTSLLLSRPIFSNRSLTYPDFGALNRWKAPEQLVWAAIGCGILLLLPVRGVKMIGMNGVIVLMMVYFFQGIAIVSYFFEKKKLPFGLRFFLYSLIAVQQLLVLVVIGCGFFDLWLNFRKLETKKSG
jgi:uncharacterized protein YybS (DUF2232 family)